MPRQHPATSTPPCVGGLLQYIYISPSLGGENSLWFFPIKRASNHTIPASTIFVDISGNRSGRRRMFGSPEGKKMKASVTRSGDALPTAPPRSVGRLPTVVFGKQSSQKTQHGTIVGWSQGSAICFVSYEARVAATMATKSVILGLN